MTGKGDRWGRDSLGRSEPAFLRASTTALPPLTCTARGRMTSAAVVLAASPAICWLFVSRPVPGGESAGCVCLQCLFCRLCFACCHLLPAMPTALNSSCPVQVLLSPSSHFIVLGPVSCPCAPGSSSVRASSLSSGPAVCQLRTVPLAAATWACSGGPCDGSILTSFSCRVHDPGPWV